jgi:hypothetical protein
MLMGPLVFMHEWELLGWSAARQNACWRWLQHVCGQRGSRRSPLAETAAGAGEIRPTLSNALLDCCAVPWMRIWAVFRSAYLNCLFSHWANPFLLGQHAHAGPAREHHAAI